MAIIMQVGWTINVEFSEWFFCLHTSLLYHTVLQHYCKEIRYPIWRNMAPILCWMFFSSKPEIYDKFPSYAFSKKLSLVFPDKIFRIPLLSPFFLRWWGPKKDLPLSSPSYAQKIFPIWARHLWLKYGENTLKWNLHLDLFCFRIAKVKMILTVIFYV